MIHLTLEQRLAEYRRHNPDEVGTVDLFLAFIASTPDYLLREHTPGHLTGSAFVIDNSNHQTLLVHHRKLQLWVQPGGHADGNSDLLAVAEQELIEETGIVDYRLESGEIFDIDRHTIPARGEVPAYGEVPVCDEVGAHYHYDVRFLFRAPADQVLIVSQESTDLRWFGLEQLLHGSLESPGSQTDESVRRMARKALARD